MSVVEEQSEERSPEVATERPSIDSPWASLEMLAPVGADVDPVFAARPLSPFSEPAMDLLAAVSAVLFKDPRSKAHPDVITFAFWCRRASLASMASVHAASGQGRIGRGVVFHIAPGNVPVNFAYSLAAGLLAGDANVVRLPSAPFPQVEVVCAAFDAVLRDPAHAAVRDHVRLVRYDREMSAITRALSSRCDVRVIWGGDDTIADIRRSPIPARAFDVTFADRYSFCVIEAARYLEHDSPRSIAEGFFNDTYLFDQNACTAPHLVVWLGDPADVREAQSRFWPALHAVVAEKYELQAVSAVDKRAMAYRFAATHEQTRVTPQDDNLLTRVELAHLEVDIEDWRSACGYFYEYRATSLEEVAPIVDRRYQTLAYLGVDADALRSFVVDRRLTGIDRIVPIGHTLDFSLEWDGYDLVSTLSRVVTVMSR